MKAALGLKPLLPRALDNLQGVHHSSAVLYNNPIRSRLLKCFRQSESTWPPPMSQQYITLRICRPLGPICGQLDSEWKEWCEYCSIVIPWERFTKRKLLRSKWRFGGAIGLKTSDFPPPPLRDVTFGCVPAQIGLPKRSLIDI